MSGPKFFQTLMGKTFFEGNIPKLIRIIEKFTYQLMRIANALEKESSGQPTSTKVSGAEGAKRDRLQNVRLREDHDRPIPYVPNQSVSLPVIDHDISHAPQFVHSVDDDANSLWCEICGEVVAVIRDPSEEVEQRETEKDETMQIVIATFENKHDTTVFPVELGTTVEDVKDHLREKGSWNDIDDEEGSMSEIHIDGPFSINLRGRFRCDKPNVGNLPKTFERELMPHFDHLDALEIVCHSGTAGRVVYLECTKCGGIILSLLNTRKA